MNTTAIRSIIPLLLSLLVSLPACAPSPLTQGQQQTRSARPAINPYTGPVEIGFDSSLISPVLARYGYQKTLPRQTLSFDEDAAFSIQAVPPGQVVYRETFTKGRQELEEVREIRIADTRKRYTLHVQKLGDPRQDGHAVVNINGTNWIKEVDFKGQTQEVARPMLLLNARNSLRVRLFGKTGNQVTVTLVEGGEAGTVLRRRGRLGQPGETQETHLRRNDVNIFDPSDPDSLGDLTPYSQLPKSEDGRSLPSISLNGGVPATVSAGEFQIKLKAPVQENLQALLQRYKGIVTDTISEDEFLVLMDLSTVDLTRLPVNLRALNALVDAEAAIEQVSFDSLEGAQMMALMTELLLAARRGERVLALDVNPVLDNNAPGSYEGITAGGKPMHAQDSWWLNQLGILKAWDYSLGFNRQSNRPVTVAVVDTNFKYLDTARQNNEDLQSQVLTTRAAVVYFKRFPEAGAQAGYRQLLTVLDPTVPQLQDQNGNTIPVDFFSKATNATGKPAHGTSQASTIASVVNNGKGIAGVAPHAKILPIKIGTFKAVPAAVSGIHSEIALGWDLRVAVEAAGRLKADIVSVTSSTVVDGISNWLGNVNTVTTGSQYGWLSALQRQVDLFAQPRNDNPAAPGGNDDHRIGNSGICVFNAGNAGNHVRHTLPAGKLKHIVIAGAMQEDGHRAIFGDPDFAAVTLFSGGTCPTPPSGSTNPCSLDSNGEAASAWWLGAGAAAPSSSVYPQMKAEIEAWENGIGAQNLKLWTPGTNMGAIGQAGSGMGITTSWGGTSAAAPFAAGALALLKSLEPTLTVSDLVSGSLLRYRPASAYSDTMLKDYYAAKTNRKGIRVSAASLSTPVLDLEQTILDNSRFDGSGNKIETFAATLRKDSSGRPYLEGTGGKTYDLTMFIDDAVFGGQSTYNDVYKNAFAKESRQLELDGWQTFWNQYGTSTTGSQVLLSSLVDKAVSVQGWRYQPSASSAAERIEAFAVREGGSGGPSPGGFTTLAVDPAQIPQDRYEYDLVGNRWLIPGGTVQMDANEFAGIHFNQPVRNLEIKIGPVLVPLVDVLEDLAVFGIPEDLPAGVHDVIVTASGQTLTLEQAVSKVSQAIPPTPEPSPPPSGNPGSYSYVRVFNLEGNDEGRVYLNDELILSAHAGEEATVRIDDDSEHRLHTDRRNELRFELVNNGGGYTYGFELHSQGPTTYTDIKGTPGVQNVVARNGQEDHTQGLVYNERIVLNNRQTPVGSGPFWVKVFNLGEDEELTLNTNNELQDPAWEDGYFRVRGNRGVVSRALPYLPFDEYCGTYNPRYECWNSKWLYFNLSNPYSPYSFGIEVYRGINLVYRNIQGQEDRWGANHNDPSDYIWIPEYRASFYRHYER